jgi:hypothetical protein
VAKREHSGSGVGGFLGILVFLGGIALLLLTFKMAYDMFYQDPAQALGLRGQQAIDLPKAGTNLAGVVIRVLVLIVMGIMGSLIANRGVSLFAGSRSSIHHPPETSEKPTE